MSENELRRLVDSLEFWQIALVLRQIGNRLEDAGLTVPELDDEPESA